MDSPAERIQARYERLRIDAVMAAVLALAVGLVAGAYFGLAARSTPPSCRAAVERADATLEAATRVDGDLRDHARVMDAADMGRLHDDAAMRLGMHSLAKGREDRGILEHGVAAWKRARGACLDGR
jgi:hypothetical protein